MTNVFDKEFYSLPQLARRWQCDVEDLLHLGGQDKVQICVNIYGLARGSNRERIDLPDDAEPEEPPATPEEELDKAAYERWIARTTRNMPHGVFELGPETLRFLEVPGYFPFELYEATKFDDGWWQVEFVPPVVIEFHHLCMLHEEVMRLDRSFKREEAEELQAAPLKIERRKRIALIGELSSRWPDIESDLRHAEENGLKRAAKLPEHGLWNLTAAMKWAEERGKLSDTTTQKLAPLEAFNRLSISKSRS